MWWAHKDSNLESAGYEPVALTIVLYAPKNSASAKNTDAEPGICRSVEPHIDIVCHPDLSTGCNQRRVGKLFLT